MTDKKEDAGKGAASPADAAGAKRTFATLDLKATEVKDKDAEASAPGAAAPSSAGSKPSVSAGATQQGPRMSDASGKKAEPPRPDAGKTADAKASASASAGAAQKPASPAPASGRSIGQLASHLAAGIVGAAVMLLGLMTLFPELGSRDSSSAATAVLQKRLAALEQARTSQAAPTDVTQKLAAAEARIQRMEEAGKSVGAIGEAQAKLAAEARALEERLGKEGSTTELASRLGKLESTLATLSAAAAQDPQASGRLSGLAQVAGKLSDLESSIDTRTASLRQDVVKDVESRVTAATEASEAAKAGAARIDREMASYRNDAARLGQRTERIEQGQRALQEETAALKVALDGLKSDVDARLKSVARPADVTAALAPITQKLAGIEQSVQGVVKGEQDRNTNAERIVLSLELANLRRALDRGQRFSAELAAVKKAAGDKYNFSALEKAQNEGVPTLAELSQEMRRVASAALDADAEPTDAGIVDRLLLGAKSIVRVRKTNPSADDKSTEATLARMEQALRDDRLGDVLAEAKSLPPRAAAPAEAFLRRIEARHAVDSALADVEAQLKSSLGGRAEPQKGQK